jgi:hypothetical protein
LNGVQKADGDFYKEDVLYFGVSIPAKSYENIGDYMTYKGRASVLIIGTELHWRRGDIYYINFGKRHPE